MSQFHISCSQSPNRSCPSRSIRRRCHPFYQTWSAEQHEVSAVFPCLYYYSSIPATYHSTRSHCPHPFLCCSPGDREETIPFPVLLPDQKGERGDGDTRVEAEEGGRGKYESLQPGHPDGCICLFEFFLSLRHEASKSTVVHQFGRGGDAATAQRRRVLYLPTRSMRRLKNCFKKSRRHDAQEESLFPI